jgi:hypothetical protein
MLLRRWYFALPMFIVTAIAVLVTHQNVTPKWIATSYVQLLPPLTETAPAAGTPPPDQRNPWIGLGLYALANAAMLTIQDASVPQQLADAGLSDTFTTSIGSGLPTVTFAVTGDSQDQATNTAANLVGRYEQIVNHLQEGVAEKDRITTKRLDLGANLKESDANVKRALVAVAAAGLLLSVGLTVGLDALLARRGRRRWGLDDVLLEGSTLDPERSNGRPDSRTKLGDERPFTRQTPRTFAHSEGTGSRVLTTVVPPADQLKPSDADPGEPDDAAALDGPVRDLGTDSTVVLPPTLGRWRPGNPHNNG